MHLGQQFDRGNHGVAPTRSAELKGGEKARRISAHSLNLMAGVSPPAKTFTPKQGQYLAFIYAYTRLHRRPPTKADMQLYFRVGPLRCR
jgi:hypothetical protein